LSWGTLRRVPQTPSLASGVNPSARVTDPIGSLDVVLGEIDR